MDNEFISEALKRLPLLPLEEQKVLLKMLDQYEHARKIELARTDFLTFAQLVDPNFKVGSHHRIINQVCNRIAKGELKRVIINIAPRHGKSHIMSYLFPAWYVGQHPEHKIIQATHTSDLSVDFGRKVRNLVGTEIYGKIFPKVGLSSDSKAAGKWNTNHEGEYYAVGVGGALAGRGAHLCLAESTLVRVEGRGLIRADRVVLGDRLYGSDGFGTVTAIMESWHTESVSIDGAPGVTGNHPIWTANKGWVDASVLTTLDVLQRITLFDRLLVYKTTRKNRGKQHTRVQHLGVNAPTVQQSESSKLRKLWRQGSSSLRKVVKVFQLLSGYGAKTVTKTYDRPDRHDKRIQSGKLPLGGCGNSAEQQNKQHQDNCVWGNLDDSTMGKENRVDARYDIASIPPHEYDARRSAYDRAHVVGAEAGSADGKKYAKGVADVRVARSYGEGYRYVKVFPTQQPNRKISIIERVLLGLYHPRSLQKLAHEPKRFLNFTVEGHNTYYINDTVLCHNCVVDDPVSEQAVLSASSAAFEQSNNWFMSGPRQRLMPGGAICIIQTRWATNDMTGFLVENMINNPDGDKWEVVELPMELPSGEPLWPEFWSKQDIAKLKATLPSKYWQAQYQQNPTADEGALIKREWWQRWTRADPPRCEFTISAWDTAFEKNSKADYSAMTYWGVFKNEEDDDNYHLILLDARRERIEFPELKVWARKHWMEDEPDFMVVEKKATGAPLIYEMRQMGIPIQEYTPVRGQDKVTRVNAISPLFETGRVWAPRTRWAEEVIEECAAFPNGKHDDFVDTVSLALLRMRMGGLVRAANDEDDTHIAKFKRRRTYY